MVKKISKKDAPVEEGAAVADAPGSEVAEPSKKGAGRGKRQPKVAADPLPPRTLRSNSHSKTTLVEPSAEKEVKLVNDGKKASKAAGKGKKAGSDETNGDSKEEVSNGVAASNGNGTAAEEKTKAGEKGKKAPKGQKKAAATNGNAEKDEEDEPMKESTEASEPLPETDSGKEKSKPVKSGKGKNKQAEKEQADEPEASSEPKAEPVSQDDAKPKESGRGKKKTEAPKDEEVVAPKKAKKESKTEVNKETEEASKPAPAETKKGKGKGGAKAKEVAIEHWNAERVKNILQPFCSPSIAFSFNKNAPRRGSFEIKLVNENNEEEIIWSGIKRGPPRKEKFPSDEEVVELAERFFSTSN